MERDRFEGRDDHARGPFAGSILLVVLPTAFLGAAYFLLVEYTLRDLLPGAADRRLALRLGGGALVVLSLVLSVGFGWLVVDRLMRPLRLLIRLPENGELSPRGAALLHTRIREYHDLYRLLGVLLNQKKAGTRALEELEELREALARLREELARTGQHGIPPIVTAVGPLNDIGLSLAAKRVHLLEFFADLRERTRRLRGELTALGQAAGLDRPPVEVDATVSADTLAPVSTSIERLRQIGTVFALEAARSGGGPGRRASELLERFQGGLTDLEEFLRSVALHPAGSDNGGRPREPVTSDLDDAVASAALGRADPAASDGIPAVAGSGSGPDQSRAAWLRLVEGMEALERRLAEAEER